MSSSFHRILVERRAPLRDAHGGFHRVNTHGCHAPDPIPPLRLVELAHPPVERRVVRVGFLRAFRAYAQTVILTVQRGIPTRQVRAIALPHAHGRAGGASAMPLASGRMGAISTRSAEAMRRGLPDDNA